VLSTLHAGVDFVEQMLRDQLIAAIGKVVTPKEFEVCLTLRSCVNGLLASGVGVHALPQQQAVQRGVSPTAILLCDSAHALAQPGGHCERGVCGIRCVLVRVIERGSAER
jgi:hypothetical protein